MKNFKKISENVIAYIAWAVSMILWLAFMLLSRTAITGVLSVYYNRGIFMHIKQTQFIGLAWIIVLGIVWVALMIITENYFRVGVKKHQLYQRIGKVFGPEIALIFLSDLTISFLIGFHYLTWTRWLVMFVELVAAAVFIWLGMKVPAPQGQFQVK